jgi:hypothetical protein
MVKAVLGDEEHLKAFEETLASPSSPPCQAQVGHSLPSIALRLPPSHRSIPSSIPPIRIY